MAVKVNFRQVMERVQAVVKPSSPRLGGRFTSLG